MIQVIHRAFDILEFLARDPHRPKPLGEIAGALSLNAATCANILKTMVERGYVHQVAPKKGYMLGLAVRGLAREELRYQKLLQVAELPMTRLASSLRETMLIAVLEGLRRVNLCLVEGDAHLQVRHDIITSDDIYRTATGRLLLAHLAEVRVEAFTIRKGLPTMDEWPGAETSEGLRAALALIREEDRVVVPVRKDLAAVASPIRAGKTVVAALGLYLPAFRFEGEHRGRVLDGMKETADAISRQLIEGDAA